MSKGTAPLRKIEAVTAPEEPGAAADTVVLEFLVDEVGIAYGRYGDIVMKSSYQPLYSLEGDWLQPFAVEALVTGLRDGVGVGAEEILGRARGGRREALERLCRTLHVRNHHAMGLPGMQLFFNADPGFSPADVEHLAWMLAEEGIAPELVTCEITEQASDDDRLRALAADLRSIGIRLAVDDFGAGHSTAGRVRTLRPDTVKVDAGWFRSVVARPDALRLLPSLFAQLSDLGCTILVEGIETPRHLLAAVEAGADLLQGYLLARPALAGTIVDEAPLQIRDLAAGGATRRA
ncbi:EAL domain-containing protein [Aquibium microcysteis]|uniref:EAL domain-containing protein n=1 Tax=Aquibium microcysteis TaxID=675281 RepID=UPI001AED34C4|nr:EAL domain-containing protein [Aquibium microcysteis]